MTCREQYRRYWQPTTEFRPKSKPPNLLEESGLPLVYPIEKRAGQTLPPKEGFDIVSTAVVRSLTVMQKEAIVSRSGSSIAWRLSAITYISAGIGFCFMTQFGRYAKILKRDLGDYRVVQDTRFSIGDPEADPPVGGRADAPRTHVYLTPDGDDDFARDALDMSEQTCFIHALCRTELRPKVKVLPWSE